MASEEIVGLGFVFFSVAIFFGIVLFRRIHSGIGWWTMLIGAVLNLLSIIFVTYGQGKINSLLFTYTSVYPDSLDKWLKFVEISLYGFVLSLGLFGVGFIYSTMRVRRIGDRIKELESIVQAQNEQISRQQS